MSGRMWAGAGMVAVLMAGAGVSAAAQEPWLDAEVRVEVREVAREVRRAVRESARDAGRELRHVTRDIVREVRRALRDVPDVHIRYEAGRGTNAGASRQARERSREERDRHRARDVRDRTHSERAFRQSSPTGDSCARRNRGRGNRGHACEVRDSRLGRLAGPLSVDATPNGGIRVQSWDQDDVLVRAIVETWAETEAEARDLSGRVQVTAAGTTVSASGPTRDDRRGRDGWSVSFEIWAPRSLALDLTAVNGGISLHGMHGESRFTTRNGGVALEDVGGRVSGRTENGGVNVRLAGTRWDGAGLDVETTNGGVSLALPRDYSAALDVSTVNGGFRTDIPMTVQGRVDRQVRATLGSGGPPVTIKTINGGVRVLSR